jgi:hypothetical protein
MKLRFTGAWPPQSLWDQYPNWENAIDEESEPDQDETTLRPSEVQHHITRDVVLTAGVAVQADGTRLPVLLELNDGDLKGINVFVSAGDAWSARLLGRPAIWTCIVEDWLPLEKRRPTVLPTDTRVFPLQIESRLPLESNGFRISATIVPGETT